MKTVILKAFHPATDCVDDVVHSATWPVQKSWYGETCDALRNKQTGAHPHATVWEICAIHRRGKALVRNQKASRLEKNGFHWERTGRGEQTAKYEKLRMTCKIVVRLYSGGKCCSLRWTGYAAYGTRHGCWADFLMCSGTVPLFHSMDTQKTGILMISFSTSEDPDQLRNLSWWCSAWETCTEWRKTKYRLQFDMICRCKKSKDRTWLWSHRSFFLLGCVREKKNSFFYMLSGM